MLFPTITQYKVNSIQIRILRLSQVSLEMVKKPKIQLSAFLPVSTLMIAWYFFVIIVLLVDYFLVIYDLCFRSEFKGKFITLPFLLFIFVLDIFISLHTSYIQKGRIIKDLKSIRSKYMRSPYFLLDIMAVGSTMIQIIISSIEPLVDCLVFARIIKLIEFDKLIWKYALTRSGAKLIYQILKHFVLLIMICHLMGSLFFFLDLKLIQWQWYDQSQLWIYSSYCYNNIADLPHYWQYAYSFYYALVTLSAVAYGDLTPLNPSETFYTFFNLLIPLIFYTYSFSALHGIIKEERGKIQENINFRRVARKYLQLSGIEQSEIPKFINYLSHATENKSKEVGNFFSQTAPSIKQAYMEAMIKADYKFDIFTSLTGSIKIEHIKEVVGKTAKEEAFPSKQVVSQSLKEMKLMYMVSGEVREIVELRWKKCCKVIGEKKFLGTYSFFTGLTQRRFNNFMETNQFSIFISVSLDRFLSQAKAESPLLFESYHEFKMKIIFGDSTSKLESKCFFCEEENHIMNQCDKLRPQVPVDPLMERPQPRQKYNRKQTRSTKNNIYIRTLQLLKKLFLSSKMEDKQPRLQAKQVQTEMNESEAKQPTLFLSRIDNVSNWAGFYRSFSFLESNQGNQ